MGNYGIGNAGDDILRDYFLERFPDVEWRVLSAHPQGNELHRFPGGIRSLLSCRWVRTLKALRQSRGMVFGGGSLWTDTESLHACIVWSLHVLFARMFRKPYLLAFQGIGPFKTRWGEVLARWVVKHASFISVRDTASFARLSGLSSTETRGDSREASGEASRRSATRFARGEQKIEKLAPSEAEHQRGRIEGWIKNTRVVQSFDPALALLHGKNESLRTKNVFIFIPRFSTGWNSRMQEKFAGFFRKIQAQGGEIRLLSLHSGDLREKMLFQRFGETLGVRLEAVSSLRSIPALLTGATCVLTERYHGAIASIAAGVPFFALHKVEGDKLHSLSSMCDCPSETLQSFREQAFLSMDWERKREKVASIKHSFEELIRKGEEQLRVMLRSEAP